MGDTSWSTLREPWERLRWARIHWQRQNGSAETLRAAAESLGVQENTYSAYERAPESSKHTALDHHRAIQFGRKFKINWVWILTGEDTPFTRTPAEQRAAQLLADASEDEQEMAVDVMAAALRRRAS